MLSNPRQVGWKGRKRLTLQEHPASPEFKGISLKIFTHYDHVDVTIDRIRCCLNRCVARAHIKVIRAISTSRNATELDFRFDTVNVVLKPSHLHSFHSCQCLAVSAICASVFYVFTNGFGLIKIYYNYYYLAWFRPRSVSVALVRLTSHSHNRRLSRTVRMLQNRKKAMDTFDCQTPRILIRSLGTF